MAFAASGLRSNCHALFTQLACTSVNSLAAIHHLDPFLLYMQHHMHVCVAADNKLFVLIRGDGTSLYYLSVSLQPKYLAHLYNLLGRLKLYPPALPHEKP